MSLGLIFGHSGPAAGSRTTAPASIDPSTLGAAASWGQRLGSLWAYQDSARSTQATADGDPVGSITNWSNSSFHWLQAVSGNRATYRTGVLAGKDGIEFNGSSAYLKSGNTATYSTTDGGGWTVVGVFSSIAETAYDRAFCVTNFDGTQSDYNDGNAFNCTLTRDSGGTMRVERGSGRANPGAMYVSSNGIAAGISGVYALRIKDASGSIEGWCRGFTGSDTYTSYGFLSATRIYLGCGIDSVITFYGATTQVEAHYFPFALSDTNLNGALTFLRSYYGVL